MPKGDKYIGLTNYLKQCGRDSETLSFDEIERYIGDSLPPSAYKHNAFWSNTRTHSVAFGWLEAGYQTTQRNLKNKQITFERLQQGGRAL